MRRSSSIPTSPPHALFARAAEDPNTRAYHAWTGREWKGYTRSQFASLVRRTAKALLAFGLQPQDNTCVLSNSRLEWVVAGLGSMTAGCVPCGIYQTSSPKEVAYIINHSEASVVFLENRFQLDKVEAELANLPSLKHVVIFDGEAPENPLVMSWEAFLDSGKEVPDEDVEKRLNDLKPEDRSMMIYTSGTTGPPKAVMLSNYNLTWTASKVTEVVGLNPEDSLVSFLPLSHIAEQMLSLHVPLFAGYKVYFCETMERLVPALRDVQPTFFFSPPRPIIQDHHHHAAPLVHC